MESLIYQNAQFAGYTFWYFNPMQLVTKQQRNVVEVSTTVDDFRGGDKDTPELIVC